MSSLHRNVACKLCSIIEIIKRGKEKVLIEKIEKDGGLSSVINFVLCNTMLWRIAEKSSVTSQVC